MSHSKTPYEIRLELLQMAKEHLDAAYQMQFAFATKMLDAMVSANKSTIEDMQKLMPTAYTVDEITKKAAELYGFVCKKD